MTEQGFTVHAVCGATHATRSCRTREQLDSLLGLLALNHFRVTLIEMRGAV